jgi:hypothetical protein
MNRFLTIITMLVILLFNALAWAQSTPVPPDDAAITISMLIGVGVAAVIQLTSGPLEAYWARIPAAARPAIAGLVGMLATCSETLISGRTWKQALMALAMGALIPGMLAKRSPVADKPPTV